MGAQGPQSLPAHKEIGFSAVQNPPGFTKRAVLQHRNLEAGGTGGLGGFAVSASCPMRYQIPFCISAVPSKQWSRRVFQTSPVNRGGIPGGREVIVTPVPQQVGSGARSHGLLVGLEPGLPLASPGTDTRALSSINWYLSKWFYFV